MSQDEEDAIWKQEWVLEVVPHKAWDSDDDLEEPYIGISDMTRGTRAT